MSDERLDLAIDRAIDEVARQMTAGELSSDFRARVVERIEGRGPHRTWRAAWTLSPVAVAAAILVAILVARPFKGRDPAPVSANQTVRLTDSAKAPAVQKPDIAYEGLPDTVRKSVRRPGPFGPGGASEIDALAPPRLDVAPLGVEALPTESVAVPQLDAIAPIAVEPLPTTDHPIDDQRPTTVEGERP
jgi:hypothetical protein